MKGVEYNQACHCQYYFCSDTCFREGVVLSDSIGFSERGEEEGGENSETVNDRQMDR